jgi:hypothetical protein
MSTVVELLRPEALEAHRKGRELPKVDPLQRSRAPLGFLALAASVAVSMWVSLVVHIDESANGLGRIGGDGRTMMISLPAGAQSSLRPGQRVTLDVGGRDVRGELTRIEAPVASVDAARLVGGRATNDAVSSIVTARADAPVDASLRSEGGVATVRLAQRRLWDLISPARVFNQGRQP